MRKYNNSNEEFSPWHRVTIQVIIETWILFYIATMSLVYFFELFDGLTATICYIVFVFINWGIIADGRSRWRMRQLSLVDSGERSAFAPIWIWDKDISHLYKISIALFFTRFVLQLLLAIVSFFLIFMFVVMANSWLTGSYSERGGGEFAVTSLIWVAVSAVALFLWHQFLERYPNLPLFGEVWLEREYNSKNRFDIIR